jgi:hypothetical protein
MAKLDFNRVVRVGARVVSLGLIAVFGMVWLQGSKTENLTLAAGATGGESYILGRALKTVVERHYPRVRLTTTGDWRDRREPGHAGGGAGATAGRTIRHRARTKSPVAGNAI